MTSQEEYLAKAGSYCPSCEGSDISSGRLQADGDYAWAECTCDVCNFQWTDNYKLVGFTPEPE